MEIFNPLYYFKKWLYISCCIRQSFQPKLFQSTGKESGRTPKECAYHLEQSLTAKLK